MGQEIITIRDGFVVPERSGSALIVGGIIRHQTEARLRSCGMAEQGITAAARRG
jgi:hypothetical protein